MFSRAYYLGILLWLGLWSSLASADMKSVEAGPDIPVHIKAVSLAYDKTTATYRARGNVTIERGDQLLNAEAVDLNVETMKAVAVGDVRLASGGDRLTGERLEINLDEGVGTLYNGILFIQESHFYIRGGKIEKTGKDAYHVRDGRFTSCDGDSPAWEITGKDLRVDVDGYGIAKHVALRAKSIPVLYSPLLVFPAKKKRQSGFLFPQLFYSDQDGMEYNLPFFWAISDSRDATFYQHYMAHRGVKHGAEYRYVSSLETKGCFMFDYLYDRQLDDGTVAGESTGYHYEGFRGDDDDRLNRKRWWVRARSDQDLPAGFEAKLDVDLVSDQDYLREFDSGYSGYEASDTYYLEEFGRELDDQTDTVRLNRLNLNRNWDYYALGVDFRWYDNVTARKHDRPDETRQNLPSISFSGSKQRISDSSFYIDLETSYDHFWRDVGTRGDAMDLHPRVYAPTTLFRYFDLEPSVGVRETLWQVEEYEPADIRKEDRIDSRELYDLKCDLSTELARIFTAGFAGIDKVKHAIRPQVVYDYVPSADQQDLPDFVDAVEKRNVITYSVINNFTARLLKEMDSRPERGDGAQPPVPEYRYLDVCRIELKQGYDIAEARRPTDGQGKRRPFSNVEAVMEFTPSDFLALEGNSTWSPYDGEFKSYDAMMALRDGRGDEVSVDYRYKQDSSESILTKAFVNLVASVSAYWESERNLISGQEIETVVGFRYRPQCWSLNLRYTDDKAVGVQEYFFEVSLYQLGGVGLGS